MRWINSLGFRIWLAINVLIIITIISLSSINMLLENERIKETIQNQGVTVSNTLSSLVGVSMLRGEYSHIHPITQSLVKNPDIQYIVVRDRYGTIIDEKGYPEDVEDTLLIESAKIEYAAQELGVAEVGLRKDTLKKEQQQLLLHSIAVALLVSFLSIILSWLISRWMLKPIKRLTQATNLVSKGELDIVVPEDGLLETQELSISFNKMAETVKSYQQILEYEVEMATKNLSEKVTTLEILSNISKTVIRKDTTRQEVVRDILIEVYAYSKPEYLSIVLRDNSDKSMLKLYSFNDTKEIITKDIHIEDSLVKQVLETMEPAIHNNIHEHKEFLNGEEQTVVKKGIKSTAVFPLVANKGVIGTINIGSSETDFYNDSHISKLSILANQIAMSIDRVLMYESLHQAAYHDYVTGLPNYRFFKNKLNTAIEKAELKQVNKMLAVIFIDMDRFKLINDTLGHDFGDALLIEVGQLIRNTLDSSACVARLGGDEFTVLLKDIAHEEEVKHVAMELLEKLAKPICVDGYDIHVSASVGISLYPQDGRDAKTLIKKADRAMYRVKELGKNNFSLYAPLKDDTLLSPYIVEQDLRKAIENDEFRVYYQPKINILNGSIAGLEALIRWYHPKKGLIMPGDFIQIAEETGFIGQIGEFILRKVAEQLIHWEQISAPVIPVSVNLSPKQFMQTNLVKSVQEVLQSTGVAPELIELEITETMTMDIERTLETLASLKELGVKISMDDFGSGYSSLNYLRHLPIDRLKIDRSFIQNITSNQNNAAIVSTIIHLAYNLNLIVTAEGVETEDEAKYLQRSLCDEVQGYYFSYPLPAEELIKQFTEIEERAKLWRLEQNIS
ncbi:EAL domain-containing protein [Bacillus sp. HMF5848]|uniref:EAL domain-containing protein n=1 Tax=Bacillus sp. HMF5848 TaxID=2495421 RepID=UPI000F78111E|nr:EAL domain-containing protein [Bacillus sp. HMF5848]RSK29017.1 EAL domain-containing protein [Bacillus sp. HMF5848]